MRRRDFIRTVGVSTFGAGMSSAAAGGPANPGGLLAENEITWTRKVPVRYTADVAVLGGGIAGVSAACAVAKSGAKVILIERFAVTGGMLTTGGVANFCGQMSGQGEVFDQIVRDLKAWNAIGYGKHSCFHYEILAIILQELLLKRKVKLLLHTRFIDVRASENGRIQECLVCGKSGIEAVRAKQFIDCTGDGDVARYAGFQTMKGGPSGYQLPLSMMYFVRHVDLKDAKPHLPEGWFDPVRKKADLPMTSIWPDGPGSNALKVKIPMFDATDTGSLTKAEITARRRMMEVLDYYQREEKKPWLLDHCSPSIGIREGCRIVGDYVLTVDDLRAGRAFDDGVLLGGLIFSTDTSPTMTSVRTSYRRTN